MCLLTLSHLLSHAPPNKPLQPLTENGVTQIKPLYKQISQSVHDSNVYVTYLILI